MRKLYLILLLVVLGTISASADTFIVYAFSGDVIRVDGKESKPVQVRDKFTSKQQLSLGKTASLTILNVNTREKVTLRGGGKGTIEAMLKWPTTKIDTTKDSYWKWLMTQVRKGGSTVAVGLQSNVTERDADLDSIAHVLSPNTK